MLQQYLVNYIDIFKYGFCEAYIDIKDNMFKFNLVHLCFRIKSA